MSGEGHIMRLVQYRLIRPDGNLLWTAMERDDVIPPVPPVQAEIPDTAGWLVPNPQVILPPWIYQRQAPDGEWKNIDQRPEPPGEFSRACSEFVAELKKAVRPPILWLADHLAALLARHGRS